MNKKAQHSDNLIAEIIKGIEKVKGEDITLLDLRHIENSVCGYFIVCSGSSNTQVNAICNAIQKEVSRNIGEKPWHVEGEQNAEWVLMDYVDVVVHIFQKPVRLHYDIEALWGDAKITNLGTQY